MRKRIIYIPVVFGFLVSSLACNKIVSIPSAPVPAPTSTPTPTATAVFTATSTPVCGMAALITLPDLVPMAVYSQTNPPTSAPFCVVRNMVDWQAFWGTSSPPVSPVDFTTQMLILVENYGICPVRTASITAVCEDSNQVSVSVKDPDHTGYNGMCAGPLYLGYHVSGVAVNNSNLPVTWTVNTTP
jgi:hypothetical protein